LLAFRKGAVFRAKTFASRPFFSKAVISTAAAKAHFVPAQQPFGPRRSPNARQKPSDFSFEPFLLDAAQRINGGNVQTAAINVAMRCNLDVDTPLLARHFLYPPRFGKEEMFMTKDKREADVPKA